MGTPRRGGTRTGLPAALSAATAGGRADRLREDLTGYWPTCFSHGRCYMHGQPLLIQHGRKKQASRKNSKHQRTGREVLQMSAYATGNTPNRWVQLWLGVLGMGL